MPNENVRTSYPEVGNIPLPDSKESARERFERKIKEQPLVPIGIMATIGALVTSAYHLRRGDSKNFNKWLRVRVAAQGLTVVAIIGGAYHYGHTPKMFSPAMTRKIDKEPESSDSPSTAQK